MRSTYKLFSCFFLWLVVASCAEDPMEKEQYRKEIYLIGAYDRVWAVTVDYSREEIQTYFTVSSSGTLPLDRDVHVKIKIDEELVDIYNRKYWSIINEDKYYKPLPHELYSIPSMGNIVIDHRKGISTNVPVFIKTERLDIDKSYVIPVEIENTTEYPVNESGRKMLILLRMKNDYSGSYQMDGYMTEANGNPRRIQKIKAIVPTGIHTARIFYGMNNESDEQEEIKAKTLLLTVGEEEAEENPHLRKVTLQPWSEEGPEITDSDECSYDPENKRFYLKYTIGTTRYEETLIREKEAQ